MRLAGLVVAAGLVAWLPASVARARDGREAATDAVFEKLVGPDEPGVAVLVRVDGKTVFVRGYGVRDLPSRARIDTRTAFRLASVTKAFTAMAVTLLVRDGKLRYEDTLVDVLPAFPAYGQAITIRHLLTHTSGLPDYEKLMEAAEEGRAPIWTADRQMRDDEVLALLRGETSGRFPPGTSWAYSNSGYVVLGLVVARVSGTPFGDFLRRRIFDPLEMKDTLAYEKDRNGVRRHRGCGRRHGGVYSTVEDLAKWDEALRASTLVSPAWMKPALTPATLADGSSTRWPPGEKGGDNLEPGGSVVYGFGWFLDPWRGRARMWHHGSTSGFRSVIERFPDDGLTVTILANRDDLDVKALALEVAEPYLTAVDTGPKAKE